MKIALLVLYNHHYTKNIDRTEEIYRGKFSHIFHLIPFYRGNKENVIPVYENSIQFQSYIAQAYQRIKGHGYTHYFVVADDMIINPAINEENLFQFIGMPEDASYITDVMDYKSFPYRVPLFEKTKRWSIEVQNILPSRDEAIKVMRSFGLHVMPSRVYAIKYLLRYVLKLDWRRVYHALYYLVRKNKPSIYPALWSYSDIIIVPSQYMEDFATYSGAFAGLDIFVEQAIPIALFLCSPKIYMCKDTKLHSINQLYSLGKQGQKDFEDRYEFKLENLLRNFPKDLFFVHPIKLSKWK